MPDHQLTSSFGSLRQRERSRDAFRSSTPVPRKSRRSGPGSPSTRNPLLPLFLRLTVWSANIGLNLGLLTVSRAEECNSLLESAETYLPGVTSLTAS